MFSLMMVVHTPLVYTMEGLKLHLNGYIVKVEFIG